MGKTRPGVRRDPRPVSRSIAAFVVVAWLAACTSDLDPNHDGAGPPPTSADGGYAYEDATVAGQVVGSDGSPRADIALSVTAGATSASQTNSVLAMLFTGGLGCFAGLCDGLDDREVAAARTASDGTYSAVLPGSYVPGYETDTDWFVAASVPAADGQKLGPTSGLEFEVNTSVQEAPPLTLWEATPSVTAGPLLTVALEDPPELRDATDLSTTVEFVNETGAPVWTMHGETVDARLLEDVPLRLVGRHQASVRVDHDHGRTIYHQVLISGVAEYTDDLVPPSRGATCTVVPAVAGCPVTDGFLQPAENAPRAATVDLVEPVDVGLVVVRGPSDCTVEVAVGDEWRSLPVVALDGAPGLTAAPERPVEARRVRVGGDNCRAGIAEVSVWVPIAPAAGDVVAGDAGLLERDGSDAGLGLWDLLATALAAGLVGVVGAVAVSRWRRQRTAVRSDRVGLR